MKKILLQVVVFIISFLSVFYLIQWYANELDNDYQFKNANLENKSSQIRILCLGNSQTLYGINPGYFSMEGFNLAYVSQTLDIDNLLLEKYIPDLKNLEYIIVQVSYTSFFEILGYQPDAWRVRNYRRYYNINPPVDKTKEFDLLITSYRNNLLKIANKIKGHELVLCNEWGFETGYDSENSLTDFTQSSDEAAGRHKAKSTDFLSDNIKNLESIIEKARKNNVNIILYTPPVHEMYLRKLDSLQLDMMYREIRNILTSYDDVIYLDWSSNADFYDADFYDSNHLNDKGAEKLTKKLDYFLVGNRREAAPLFQ